MQNITCNQTQQVSGGMLGITGAQLQQIGIMTFFVMPKALFSVKLASIGLNPAGLPIRVISELGTVAMTGGAMILGNYLTEHNVATNHTTTIE